MVHAIQEDCYFLKEIFYTDFAMAPAYYLLDSDFFLFFIIIMSFVHSNKNSIVLCVSVDGAQ